MVTRPPPQVRSNETLGGEGIGALEAFMKTQRVSCSTSVARSLCGITPGKSALEVPQNMAPIEVSAARPPRRCSHGPRSRPPQAHESSITRGWMRDTSQVRAICADLENAVWTEGISEAMGTKTKGVARLSRVGGSSQGTDKWLPLIWASKQNQKLVAACLIERGHDVNKQESATDKSNSGYAPLHWAAHKVMTTRDTNTRQASAPRAIRERRPSTLRR
jgi:hypothetical protein